MTNKYQNVLYFHGLESKPGGHKVHYLNYEVDFVKAPEMDYTDPNLFEDWLDYIEREEPDLIIGSSMGGYFAMLLATHTKTKVLAFNPALHSRTIEIKGAKSGNEKLEGLVILGKKDDVIDPKKTLKELDKFDGLSVSIEEKMAHRVPLPIFIDGVDHFLLTQ
tara:strand:- start:2870 stop:3358 length:489 start_codon:yes stop_codon:yes gene_type:complete